MPRFLLFLLALLLVPLPRSFAQGPEVVTEPQPPSQVAQQLLTIQRDIGWLSQEVDRKRKQVAAAGKEEAADLSEDLADLQNRLERARLNFVATASQVELPPPDAKAKPKKRDLLQEAQQFIEPLFDAVHRVSEKPRRIEGYRNQIYILTGRLTQLDQALTNLDRVLKDKTYPDFQAQLEESRQTLAHNRDELQMQADAFNRKLTQELADHRTVAQIISEDILDFLSSQGRNLIIAALVFVFVFWACLWLKRYFFRLRLLRARPHLIKVLQLLYGVLAGLVGLFAVLTTLHLLNDWFLVTVLTVTLIGVAWTFKALLPVFVNEMKLVLNVGPVKQGERVLWQGVPWLVRTLGFRSVLANPDLQGAEITLSASALAGLLSRAPADNEPWFPTRVGDFVALDDGVFGRVEIQTPETVVMSVGHSRKHYSTASFLAKNPQNYARGFELTAEFQARHDGAPLRLDAIAPAFEKAARAQLAARATGQADAAMTRLDVGAVASGARSTRVWARADCAGKVAVERDALKRELLTAISEAWRHVQA